MLNQMNMMGALGGQQPDPMNIPMLAGLTALRGGHDPRPMHGMQRPMMGQPAPAPVAPTPAMPTMPNPQMPLNPAYAAPGVGQSLGVQGMISPASQFGLPRY